MQHVEIIDPHCFVGTTKISSLNYYLVKSILYRLTFTKGGGKMTRTITFDTLAYVKKLKAAGVPEKQAEVQAETFAEIIEDRIATKHDILLLKQELKLGLADTKAEIIKWVAGMLVAQAAIVATLVKLL
jgi:hypothetical protein